jgi:hypothetical protein
MKIFEFHRTGTLSIIEEDYIFVTLSPDEVAELVTDYHRNQIERVGRLQWLREWFGLLGLMFYQ